MPSRPSPTRLTEILLASRTISPLRCGLWVGDGGSRPRGGRDVAYRQTVAPTLGEAATGVVTKNVGGTGASSSHPRSSEPLSLSRSPSPRAPPPSTALPALHGHKLLIAVSLVVLLALIESSGNERRWWRFHDSDLRIICLICGDPRRPHRVFHRDPRAGANGCADHVAWMCPGDLSGLGRGAAIGRLLLGLCDGGVRRLNSAFPCSNARSRRKCTATTLAIRWCGPATGKLTSSLLARATGVKIVENWPRLANGIRRRIFNR